MEEREPKLRQFIIIWRVNHTTLFYLRDSIIPWFKSCAKIPFSHSERRLTLIVLRRLPTLKKSDCRRYRSKPYKGCNLIFIYGFFSVPW